MIVRPAEKTDAKAMAKVSVMTWKSAYAKILPADVLQGLSIDKRAERMRQSLERGDTFWVAEREGKIIGFASAGKSRAKEVEADAELYAIYVLPSYHGRGVGRELLSALMPKLLDSGMRTMCVFAFKENELARKFYVGLGAREHDVSVFNVAGVDYPDQSYVWDSLEELSERLAVKRPVE